MRAADRSILIGLAIVGLLAAFWFMLLSPKRDRASELEQQVAELSTEVAEQEALANAAVQAQADYGRNYERLVVLGKAAPADGDTPSLVAQLAALSDQAKTRFRGLTLEAGDGTAVPPAPAAQTTTDQNADEGVPTAATPAEPVTPAPPTEASASVLPLGASVGPAGLAVMPYSLQFGGSFFQVADLLARLDSLVGVGKARADVSGRLITVDGFTMGAEDGASQLDVDLSITSYVLPDSQGLTAGATPAAPPAQIPPATATPTPVSQPTP